MKTPTWKAIQNQMLVDTARSVPCVHSGSRKRKLYQGRGRREHRSSDDQISSRAARSFVVTCPTRMDAELEKLVESGKLTAKAADQLEKLKPGTFCLHKSWGFGRVAEWNLLLNQIVIDFPGKKGHPMQLHYAAENLTVIPPDIFSRAKATDLAVDQGASEERSGRRWSAIFSRVSGGSATVTQISQLMVGDIFSEAEWKRWWESTREALKKEGYFLIPAKKTRADRVARAKRFRARMS